MTGQRVYRLPEDIATKADFFAAVIDTLPLNPPLAAERQVWDRLADSLFQGLQESPDTHITIIWPAPAMTDEADFATARSIFDDVAKELYGSKVVAVSVEP
jgi:hypothetical protein